MVKLEFYDPAGITERAQGHAPRLTRLDRKRVGIVSNNHWQAHRLLPMIKSWLEQDFEGVEVLPLETFPQGSHLIDRDETAALIKQRGVDAVIMGNAA